MILSKKAIAAVAASSLALGVMALAQGRGRGGGPPMGGPPAAGPGMGAQRGGRSLAEPKGRPGTMAAPEGRKSATELLSSNSKLTDRLGTLLGVPSSQVPAMAGGFKNLGQFVAAAHVSKNLGIPFGELGSAMAKDGSLGKAIHQLKPGLSSGEVKAAVRTGNREAKSDINESR